MKKNILIGIVICILLSTNSIFTYAEDDSLEQFRDAVNKAWVQRDYEEIQQLIQNRLNNHPNDVLALGVKMYYYVFCSRDLSKARETGDEFFDAVRKSGNSDMIQLSSMMRDEIYSIPLSESKPYTQEQIDVIHNEFNKSFPLIERFYSMATTILSR